MRQFKYTSILELPMMFITMTMHAHHKETFISKYIFSQDHKMISKQFLITGIIWAIIGALFSVFFRLQLGCPDKNFPILETFLGEWAEGGKIALNFIRAGNHARNHPGVLCIDRRTHRNFANLLIPFRWVPAIWLRPS